MFYFKTHYATASMKKEKQIETTTLLNQNEGGWYQLYSYYLRPDTPLTQNELYYEEKDASNYTYPLSLLEFNLAEYRFTDLDSTAINNIHTIFRLFQDTKSKVIVRFLYDWDGKGFEKEPDRLTLIEKHMKQIGTVLNKYKDIIYTTQGIFVGSWGEMHTSKFLSDKDMTSLLLQYASVTDSSIYLSVRTPAQYKTILKELQNNPSYYSKYSITTKEIKKRLGLFNDGLLGSESDVGTYQKVDAATTLADKKTQRKKELQFQNELCKHVPNGGEAIIDNPFNNLENAIRDFSMMHISYLNQAYDEKVITKWRKTQITKKDSLFYGMNGYDYITRHLGPRFVIRDCNFQFKTFQKKKATGSILIENTGFSNLYHKKRFQLSLYNVKTKSCKIILDSKNNPKISCYDATNWNSHEKTVIPFSFSPFDFEPGTYQLLLQLSNEKTGEIFEFANKSYQKQQKGYLLGTITLNHF